MICAIINYKRGMYLKVSHDIDIRVALLCHTCMSNYLHCRSANLKLTFSIVQYNQK